MVLTQHEMKSRCWPKSEQTNHLMHMNAGVFSTGHVLPNSCMETTDAMVRQDVASVVGSSNGYYGYQPVSSSTKQEHFVVNDCDMSMNCDNVQDRVTFGCGPNNLGANQHISDFSTHLSSNYISDEIKHRKRQMQANDDVQHCSKKLRQEGFSDKIRKTPLTPHFEYASMKQWKHEDLTELLLHGIHGSSTYHWLRNLEHD